MTQFLALVACVATLASVVMIGLPKTAAQSYDCTYNTDPCVVSIGETYTIRTGGVFASEPAVG